MDAAHLNQHSTSLCDTVTLVNKIVHNQNPNDEDQRHGVDADVRSPELTILSGRQMSNQIASQINHMSSGIQNCDSKDGTRAGAGGHVSCNSNSSDSSSSSNSNSNSTNTSTAPNNLLPVPTNRGLQSHAGPNFRTSVDHERRSYRPQKFCAVCGDKAIACNFNAVTCESCKAFFRRNAYKEQRLKCLFENRCTIDRVTRRFCSKCRLLKCFQIGMKREWILTDEQKRIKKVKIMQNKQSRQRAINGKPMAPSDQQIVRTTQQQHQRQAADRSSGVGRQAESSGMSQHKSSNSLCSANQTSSSSSSSSASSSPSSTTPSCLSPVSSMSRSISSGGLVAGDVNQPKRVQMVDASTSCAPDEFERDSYGNLAARLVQYCSMASQCQYCSIRLTDTIQLRQQQSQFAAMSQLHYQSGQNQFAGQQTAPTTNQVASHNVPQDKANLNTADLYLGAQPQVYIDEQPTGRQNSLSQSQSHNTILVGQQPQQGRIAHQLHQDTHAQISGNHPYGNINDNGNSSSVNHQLTDNRNGCAMNQLPMAAVIGSNSQDIINNNGNNNPFPVSYCCISQPRGFPNVSP